jgi:protein-tyrosine phosphatase
MKQALPIAINFIHQKRDIEGKNVLVHCHAGMQRSATIIIGYLCRYYRLSLNQSINHILSKRKVAFHHGKHLNFYESLMHFCTS